MSYVTTYSWIVYATVYTNWKFPNIKIKKKKKIYIYTRKRKENNHITLINLLVGRFWPTNPAVQHQNAQSKIDMQYTDTHISKPADNSVCNHRAKSIY